MPCTAFSSCRLCRFLLWYDTLSSSALLKLQLYISRVSKKTIRWFDILWKGVIIWIFKHSGRWKIWAVLDAQRSDPARLGVSSLRSTTMASCSFPLMCCQLELVNENERDVSFLWDRKKMWKVSFVSHRLSFLCTDCCQDTKLYRFSSTGGLNSDWPAVPFSDRQTDTLVLWVLLLQNKPINPCLFLSAT